MGTSTYQRIANRQKRAANKLRIEAKEMTPSQVIEGISDGVLRVFNTSDNKTPIANNYVIHRSMHLLAQNTAQLPLRIFRGEDVMPRGFKLPGGFDLQNPNSAMSLYEFIYEGTMYYYYRGEQMFQINLIEGTNKVLSLTVVNPRFMTENVDRELGKIVSWKFGIERELIPVEQLIYTKFFDPDGLRGLGPVQVVKNELLTDVSAVEYNTKFFENFGKIGGTLFSEQGQATPDTMEKLVKEFNAWHQGSGKAYKTLGLPAGVKYQEAQQTLKEMQFLESRKDIRDRILVAMGIPKSVVGITDQVDRAVADTAMRALWQLTIKPNAIRMQNKLNQQLFKPYYPEYHCEFDFSGIEELKTDQVIQAQIAKNYRELGYTLNEINERFNLGMDEVDDAAGDIRLVPQNMIPFTDYTEPITDPAKAVVDPIEKEVEKQRLPRGLERNHMKLERKYETQMTKKLRLHFSKELIQMQKLIRVPTESAKAINDIVLLVGIKNLLNNNKEVLAGTMRPIYVEGSTEAIEMAQNTLKVTIVPRVSETVVNEMTNKIVGIQDHTYNLIRNQVVDSSKLGESVDQLSKRVNSVYKFNASRSRTIARTESGTLINRSTDEEYRSHGVRMKRWLALSDSRPSHKGAHEQGNIPYDDVFNNGLRFPHDPAGRAAEVINCRCTLAPIVE